MFYPSYSQSLVFVGTCRVPVQKSLYHMCLLIAGDRDNLTLGLVVQWVNLVQKSIRVRDCKSTRHTVDTDTQMKINNKVVCLDTFLFRDVFFFSLSTCRTRAPAHPFWWPSCKPFRSLWPGRYTCSHALPTCQPEKAEEGINRGKTHIIKKKKIFPLDFYFIQLKEKKDKSKDNWSSSSPPGRWSWYQLQRSCLVWPHLHIS